ncbi:protease modulator HflC [Candidatus Pantoea edessiphila]|nr:protease modulator HflC [Candidatus Pantoea edessiphila]
MHKIITLIIIVILMMCRTSLCIVNEGHKAILVRFSKIVRDKNNNIKLLEPGLHFKIPFIDIITSIDNRIHTTNIKNNFFSKEGKEIVLDFYIKWRVNNFNDYYMSTKGDILKTEMILNRKSNDILNIHIAHSYLKDVINDLKSHLTKDVYNALSNINIENKELTAKSINNNLKFKNNTIGMSGIEIVDMNINNIELTNNELNCIFNRIRNKHKLLAQKQILKGKEESKKIRMQANYQADLIMNEAKIKALIIKNDNDVKIARMFADHFKNDMEFYTFIRSLTAYKKIFRKKKDLIVLSLDSDFFKYIKNPLINKY